MSDTVATFDEYTSLGEEVRPRSGAPSDGGQASTLSEQRLVDALRNRDEAAFTVLVESHQSSLLRVAQIFVSTRAVAEEVVQETWVGVLQGLDRFECRSSLKTWIFRILMNRAKTRGQRENRSIPFSQLFDADAEGSESALDPERFLAADHPQWPGHWAIPPRRWDEDPERALLSKETQAHLKKIIAGLPRSQREVITFRDIEEWTSEEVCNVLGITETNQRVLLHRARSKVRAGLENFFQAQRSADVGSRENNLSRGSGASY